ncbi:hypothetical protein HOD96_02740 [Candidatus Falkowbacteria bacterium]|nr:hypothetical protein [Candidatus Falkowbacteria bacterium]MBT4433506.1 hypothetical protein [Candidatus Falkowbacteria bacterium]
MLVYIHKERTRIDDAVNDIILKCDGKIMSPDAPAADLEELKQQGRLFNKEKR